MQVFFIRHGVTEQNAKRVHQFNDAPISEEGRRQAAAAAHALKDKEIDVVYTSDLLRATETADVVASELTVPIEISPLFAEIRRPSSLVGRSYYHPKTFWYVMRMMLARNDPNWSYEDAETLHAIHLRAGEVARMLARLAGTHERIAVVSHAIFLEILMANLCKNGALDFTDYFPIFSPFSRIENGSISEFICHPITEGANVCAWEERSINDTSHLA